jgi:hypothetical protein
MDRSRNGDYQWLAAIVLTLYHPIVASAALTITEVQTQTTIGTASAINGDWWELTNSGPAAVNLSSYTWADTEDDLFGGGPNPNGFPSYMIAPGESVIIIDEDAASEAAWRTNWGLDGSVEIFTLNEMVDYPPADAGGAFSGLGNANDAVYFYYYDPLNPGDTVLLSSYSWASNVRGTTFEATTGGTNLGLSVVGEYGAVMAVNGDIGSPGVAVPEPAAIPLFLMSSAVSLLPRRTRSPSPKQQNH